MGHTCPNCGQMCYCSGDIDDIDFGEWDGCKCDCQDEANDDEPWYDDETD